MLDKIITLEDAITNKDYIEKLSNTYKTMLINNIDTLLSNITFFKELIKNKIFTKISSKNYELLKKIEDIVDEDSNIELNLIDDFRNMDRSYIEPDYFKKTMLTIPLSYVLWNINIKNECSIAHSYFKDGTYEPVKIHVYKKDYKITKEEIDKINIYIKKLYAKYKKYDYVERVILISNFLQNKIHYIDRKNKTLIENKTYITENNQKIGTEVHKPIDVLINGYGTYEGISTLTTLLLNNPKFNINIRNVYGRNNIWNIVKVDNKYYYLDTSKSITKNKNKYPNSLKSKCFNYEYLLYGKYKLYKNQGNVSYVVEPLPIAFFSYSKNRLKKKINKLKEKENFENYKKPKFKSYVK